MHRKKALLALLAAFALLLTLLAACAQGTADQPTPSQGTPSDSEPSGSGEDTQTPASEDTEITEINYTFYDFSSTGADYGERIAAAVNELTEQEIGVHVDFSFVVPGDWKSKVSLAIAGGEVIDLMQIVPPLLSLSSLYASNQVLDITDYLTEYAPDAAAMMQPYFGNFTIDGRYFGIPANRGLCTNQYLLLRRDMLEETGMLEAAQNMTSWSEYEQIMQAVTERYQSEGIFANTNGVIDIVDGLGGDRFDETVKSLLTESTGTIFVGADGVVQLKQAMPEFQALLERMQDWGAKGYIYPDALYGTVIQDDLFKQDVAFSGPQNGEYGVAVSKSASFGKEVIAVEVRQGTISGAGWGLAIPVTSEEPEAACRFINLCYTNADLMNLMIRGEKGVDYQEEDGQVAFVEGGHYQQTATFFGNELIITPLAGNGADFYEKVAEINANAAVSPFIGFSLNTADQEQYVSQLSAVQDQYKWTMACGGYTEDGYQEYLTKLRAAGADEYVAALQEQLDAWLAAN